ncbi:hypothetical protein COY28_05395 [Candidatus Woesearchaeota archaeon CG_4_10_14_0_2_um_filter_57_5]|nr:MAG: hypothetical protein AUJ68_02995 [Candidatus Woesearchaeota archaeon CG1_02_57_44]PIN68091.1 MAG: hypothetical protein COV94_06110 [Candidatus Woesearchaeota archaeon CG11_big_fil_rev_8_21_14_0_20_57_5]PIZ50569.1 MAG: hypothetical protein COY28_05395 [Candidatus Woesearchaeota archaeon CG_4_10_14_0_2_um_filter_57_5]
MASNLQYAGDEGALWYAGILVGDSYTLRSITPLTEREARTYNDPTVWFLRPSATGFDGITQHSLLRGLSPAPIQINTFQVPVDEDTHAEVGPEGLTSLLDALVAAQEAAKQ